MANAIAGAPMPATIEGGISPTKGTPNRRPTPPMRRAEPALPEPIDAFDVLERVGEIGVHWWSLIDSVLETHQLHDKVHPHPVEPLPQWAVDRLKDQGRHGASEREFSQKQGLLCEWLHLAAGDGSQYRFEVWTSRGARLAFRHESLVDATAVLDRLKPAHPEAFIARVHVLSGPASGRQDDPALLDTLIGTASHVATAMIGEEDNFTVQDETGRQATVPASVLRQHPVYERLDKRGKESLNFYLDSYKPRKEAIRAAAKDGQP